MSTLQALLSFSVAVGLLTITPGLDTVLILRTATVKGGRAALWVGLGIGLGCLIWCVLTAIGLGALLATSQVVYNLLRTAGACYLVYLGIQLWLKSAKPEKNPTTDLPETDLSETALAVPLPETEQASHRWFTQGLFTNLLNPKVGVFYVTFLPQFLPEHANVPVLGTGMGLIHALVGLLWFSILILATRPLARWLKRASVVKMLDRVTGSVLIGFGAKLALEPSH